jgi:TRAP-type mannitol/chloroaromatic compound transport system permease large subunit
MLMKSLFQFLHDRFKLCGVLCFNTLGAQFADAVFQAAGGHRIVPPMVEAIPHTEPSPSLAISS